MVEAVVSIVDRMKHDFSCCSLDSLQKEVKIKVCLKYRHHNKACSMVYSKSLLTNVYKTCFIRYVFNMKHRTENWQNSPESHKKVTEKDGHEI